MKSHYSLSSFGSGIICISRPELSEEENEKCRAALKFLHKMVGKISILNQAQLYASRSDIESVRTIAKWTQEGGISNKSLKEIGEEEGDDD